MTARIPCHVCWLGTLPEFTRKHMDPPTIPVVVCAAHRDHAAGLLVLGGAA